MGHAVQGTPDTQEPKREQGRAAQRCQAPNTEAPDGKPGNVEPRKDLDRYGSKTEQRWKLFVKSGQEFFGEVGRLGNDRDHRETNRTWNQSQILTSPAAVDS